MIGDKGYTDFKVNHYKTRDLTSNHRNDKFYAYIQGNKYKSAVQSKSALKVDMRNSKNDLESSFDALRPSLGRVSV